MKAKLFSELQDATPARGPPDRYGNKEVILMTKKSAIQTRPLIALEEVRGGTGPSSLPDGTPRPNGGS